MGAEAPGAAPEFRSLVRIREWVSPFVPNVTGKTNHVYCGADCESHFDSTTQGSEMWDIAGYILYCCRTTMRKQ